LKTDARRQLLYVVCFLAAFHPNCQRCCPTDNYGGCTCRWAWEECPTPTGCNACNTSTKTFDAPGNVDASMVLVPIDGGAHAQASEMIGATCAFAGSHLVAAVPESDSVHVMSVESTPWDEDPLTVRSVGTLIFQGEEPGRVVAKNDIAYVALRRGAAVAMIDARSATLVKRLVACAAPRGLAVDREDLLVACASGEVVRIAADGERMETFVASGFEDVGVFHDALVASTKMRVYTIDRAGTITSGLADGAVARGESLALSNELRALTPEGELGPSLRVRDEPMRVFDLSLFDGTVAIAGGGDAFLLAHGAQKFSSLGRPGNVRALAIADVAGETVRRVLALQTEAPRAALFVTLAHAPAIDAIEPLP